jgi:hypothetical protein
LEALAPLVVSLQETGSEQTYLRSLDRFVEEKEKQIEEICDENYEVDIEGRVHIVGGLLRYFDDLGLCLVSEHATLGSARNRSSAT